MPGQKLLLGSHHFFLMGKKASCGLPLDHMQPCASDQLNQFLAVCERRIRVLRSVDDEGWPNWGKQIHGCQREAAVMNASVSPSTAELFSGGK